MPAKFSKISQCLQQWKQHRRNLHNRQNFLDSAHISYVSSLMGASGKNQLITFCNLYSTSSTDSYHPINHPSNKVLSCVAASANGEENEDRIDQVIVIEQIIVHIEFDRPLEYFLPKELPTRRFATVPMVFTAKYNSEMLLISDLKVIWDHLSMLSLLGKPSMFNRLDKWDEFSCSESFQSQQVKRLLKPEATDCTYFSSVLEQTAKISKDQKASLSSEHIPMSQRSSMQSFLHQSEEPSSCNSSPSKTVSSGLKSSGMVFNDIDVTEHVQDHFEAMLISPIRVAPYHTDDALGQMMSPADISSNISKPKPNCFGLSTQNRIFSEEAQSPASPDSRMSLSRISSKDSPSNRPSQVFQLNQESGILNAPSKEGVPSFATKLTNQANYDKNMSSKIFDEKGSPFFPSFSRKASSKADHNIFSEEPVEYVPSFFGTSKQSRESTNQTPPSLAIRLPERSILKSSLVFADEMSDAAQQEPSYPALKSSSQAPNKSTFSLAPDSSASYNENPFDNSFDSTTSELQTDKPSGFVQSSRQNKYLRSQISFGDE